MMQAGVILRCLTNRAIGAHPFPLLAVRRPPRDVVLSVHYPTHLQLHLSRIPAPLNRRLRDRRNLTHRRVDTRGNDYTGTEERYGTGVIAIQYPLNDDRVDEL